jgi:MFS family permease
MTADSRSRAQAAPSPSLEPNVVAASGAVFLLGAGEEIWRRFLPRYVEALGGSARTVGFFGAAESFFDAVYQYPGGFLADRLGRRRAFLVFIALASLGYLTYLLSPSWPFLFLGLALATAWRSMASPGLFAVVGDALSRERRAYGFTVQAIARRVPMVICPVAGGLQLARSGLLSGMKSGFAITLGLAGLAALVVFSMELPRLAPAQGKVQDVWRSFPVPLRRLLLSDVIIRTAEGLSEVFVILYVTRVTGLSLAEYGFLVGVQVTTSILVYFPSAAVADRLGRKPVVTATFLCFALFPLSVALASGLVSLLGAFVLGGMREAGEPARKAMIVDLADPGRRGRTVGLYYLLRGLAVTPAAALGGVLWGVGPAAPFLLASAVGLSGAFVFVTTLEEDHAA